VFPFQRAQYDKTKCDRDEQYTTTHIHCLDFRHDGKKNIERFLRGVHIPLSSNSNTIVCVIRTWGRWFVGSYHTSSGRLNDDEWKSTNFNFVKHDSSVTEKMCNPDDVPPGFFVYFLHPSDCMVFRSRFSTSFDHVGF